MPPISGDSKLTLRSLAPSFSVRSPGWACITVKWLGRLTPACEVTRPVCARYTRWADWSNSTTFCLASAASVYFNNSSRTRSPPLLSSVALSTSVVIVSFSVAVGKAAAVTGAVGVAAAAPAAVGTPAGNTADAPGVAAPVATALTGAGANIDGLPLCLFQASHNRTSETENTTQRMVRRMSVMGGSSKRVDG